MFLLFSFVLPSYSCISSSQCHGFSSVIVTFPNHTDFFVGKHFATLFIGAITTFKGVGVGCGLF